MRRANPGTGVEPCAACGRPAAVMKSGQRPRGWMYAGGQICTAACLELFAGEILADERAARIGGHGGGTLRQELEAIRSYMASRREYRINRRDEIVRARLELAEMVADLKGAPTIPSASTVAVTLQNLDAVNARAVRLETPAEINAVGEARSDRAANQRAAENATGGRYRDGFDCGQGPAADPTFPPMGWNQGRP